MMRPALLILPFALAACDVRTGSDDGNVHVGFDGVGSKGGGGNTAGPDQLSVTVPGVDAKVTIPGLDLGAHVDMDGVKLAPHTNVGGIDVADHDHGGDSVRIAFADPDKPGALLDYYRNALGCAGFTVAGSSADAIRATKGAKTFMLALTPDGSGSRGTITITGD